MAYKIFNIFSNESNLSPDFVLLLWKPEVTQPKAAANAMSRSFTQKQQITLKSLFCQSLSDVSLYVLLFTNWRSSCRGVFQSDTSSYLLGGMRDMTLPWSGKVVSDLTDELAVCLNLDRSENISQSKRRWKEGDEEQRMFSVLSPV